MTSSDVCPTEDALKAFLEYLVDPMLPAKSSIRDNLPLSQQQSVAKQVHSVVLLYNYYHRKQYPQLAFLSFDEFCKLAAILRPTLSVHMKYIQEPEVGVEKQSSLTEEKILNACKICKYLDAAKNVPDIEGWPISKVAVLLIDSKKENCFLLFSSITEGVWSVIENDTDTFIQNSEVVSGASGATFKKKRVIKKPKKIVLNSEEDQILQIGYSAVKEVAGANKTDIMVLESYTVYSQTKAKTASRFYIMKCSQLINQEFIQVPIKYLIESLQGPLVKRSTGSWTVTSVVEYFHVLPYSEKISGWISRETFSNSLQDSKPSEKNMMVGSPEVTKSYMSSEGLSIDLNKSSSDAIEALHQNENSGSCAVTLSASMKETPDVYLDKSLVSPSKNKEECQHIANTLQVSEDQEIENPSVCHYSSRSKNPTEDDNVDSSRMLITEGETKEQSTCDKICAKTSFENNSIEERALIANNPNSDLEKLQIAIASKGKTLSQTALNALIRKRIALALQQRKIEEEIALCDKKIQRMLTGGEDDLELKIESIIEGCNDTWVRNLGRTCPHLEDQPLPPPRKQRRLTDAVLFKSPCQARHYDTFHENNWLLPIYHVSQAYGGFQANIAVKGPDFQCSCGGDLCPSPHEARESAAAQMLANLRIMAKSDQ
uniref:Uncharacterized protein n=1 Tax=Cajanus cajan TaxID=3821 RepID=A0A151SUJ4_CAJCA|nr:hypothetical protein KK1_013856 [Cajanus cajan]